MYGDTGYARISFIFCLVKHIVNQRKKEVNGTWRKMKVDLKIQR